MPGRDPHRIVDAIVGRQRTPHRGVAVFLVGDQGQVVAGDHRVHPLDRQHSGRRILGLPAWEGISSRFTVQTARIGTPFEANRVYLAVHLGDVGRKAGDATPFEHDQRGHRLFGGTGFVDRDAAAEAASRPNSRRSGRISVSRRRTSPGGLQGSAPLYSGGPAFFAPLAGFFSHCADLLIVTSFGLNWNAIVPREAPGLLPPGADCASYISRLAWSCAAPGEVTMELRDCSAGSAEL